MLPRIINKTSSFLKKLVGLDDIYTIAIRKRKDLSLFEGIWPRLRQSRIQRNTGMQIQY